MYINPVLFGALVVIFAELAIMILYAIFRRK